VTVLDASAILAFLQGERGDDVVEAALLAGATCGAANWSEIMQKSLAAGRDWTATRALLGTYGLTVEPVSVEDAQWAARRWRTGEGLSLGDRLCLALGERLDVPVLTADVSWGTGGRIRQIR
jgi:PIN domain nuclease of toxin-antitoxin system